MVSLFPNSSLKRKFSFFKQPNFDEKEIYRKNIIKHVRNYITKFHNPKVHLNNIPVSGKIIDAEEISNLVEASLDLRFTSGRFTKDFEKKISKIIGVKYLLTCNSGSSANLLAISSLCSVTLGKNALKKGDEVITCSTGFPTTVNPIIINNLVPVFVDASLPTYNIDVNLIERAISEKTKAIAIAHTLGNPFDLEKVKNICDKYNLYLIEDCCDALGSKYKNKHVGTFGDIGTLSFYPAHHITMGEGGAVFCSSSKIKRVLDSIRDWGRDCWCDTGCDNTCKKRFEWKLGELPKGYDHKYIYTNLGYNFKITEMQAALGLAQLGKLEAFINIRRENYSLLLNLLEDLKEYLILPEKTSYSNPSWFGFPLTIKEDDRFSKREIIIFLEEKGIATRPIFAGNIVRQPYMRSVNYKKVNDLKVSDRIMEKSFWLGLYPGLNKDHIQYISRIIHNYFKKA